MSSDGSRRRDITVADVAKAAQVSKAQAARALGNYGAVSDDVRERVLAAAEELAYRPNELARSMNTGKSNTIGVVVGDIENPHFGLATRGITDTAKKSGFNVILVNTDEETAAEVDAVRVLLDKRVDGLIVAPASSVETQHLQRVHDSGRPLVLLDRTAGGARRRDHRRGHGRHLLRVHPVPPRSRAPADRVHLHAEDRRPRTATGCSWIPRRSRTAWTACGARSRNPGLALAEDLVRLNAGDAESIRHITRELLLSAGPGHGHHRLRRTHRA